MAFENPFLSERWLTMSVKAKIGFCFSLVVTVALSILCIIKAARVLAAADYWIYLIALIAAAVTCLTVAWRLKPQPSPIDTAARDVEDARALGAAFMLLVAPAPLLVANSLFGRQPGPDAVGVFDVLTWLGTLATLAVVVSGAWVAVYVKRRDDERQHRLSVMGMRQVWINNLRDDLSELTSAAETLHRSALAGISDQATARVALERQKRVALRLNPTEPHHHMLLLALKGLLWGGCVHDHMRPSPIPAPLVVTTSYEVASEWTTLLAQMVLKIEWVVTSLGAEFIEEKVTKQWDALLAYEKTHGEEIRNLVHEFDHYRKLYSCLNRDPERKNTVDLETDIEVKGEE